MSHHRALCLIVPLLAAACASRGGATREPAPSAAPAAAAVQGLAEAVAAEVDADVYGDLWTEDAEALLQAFGPAPEATAADTTHPVSYTTEPVPPARHRVTALRLREGRLLAGDIVSDDGTRVTIRFTTETGTTGTATFPYSALHPDSVCELMLARAEPGDAAAALDIAEYAAAQGLFDVARAHYLAAAAADPAVAPMAEARVVALGDRAAAVALERGRALVERGDDVAARRVLRRLVAEFEGTSAAADAAALVDAIGAREAQQKVAARIEARLGGARSDYLAAVENTTRGLAAGTASQTAVSRLLGARAKGASARRRLEAAARDVAGPGDPLDAEVDALRARLDAQELENEVQLGGLYLDRGELAKARVAVQAALAIAPQDPEALSLLARIRAAEDALRQDDDVDRDDLWWYRWRRYRVVPYPTNWRPWVRPGWRPTTRPGWRSRPTPAGPARGGGIQLGR